MKLTLAEPKYFKDSISIISDLVNEAVFKISKDGIELIAMDPANVAMVIFKLLSTTFTEYKVEKEIELGINLGNLKQLLRRVKPSDMLSIEVAESKLKIQLIGKSTRTFFLPIIDLEEKEQKVPELSFPLGITMDSSILTEAIEDADIVADSVSFELDDGMFILQAEGDLSKAKIEIKEGDGVKIKSSAKGKVKAKYSIEYLKKMINGSKIASEAVVAFNNDYPLRLEYKELDKVQLSFILAPRVEND